MANEIKNSIRNVANLKEMMEEGSKVVYKPEDVEASINKTEELLGNKKASDNQMKNDVVMDVIGELIEKHVPKPFKELFNPNSVLPGLAIGLITRNPIAGITSGMAINTMWKQFNAVKEGSPDYSNALIEDRNIDFKKTPTSVFGSNDPIASVNLDNKHVKGLAPFESIKSSARPINNQSIDRKPQSAPSIDGKAEKSVETSKVETPKVEKPKVEKPKVEAPKVETPKVETSKVETPKVETSKVETSKVETSKVEAPTVVKSETVVIKSVPEPVGNVVPNVSTQTVSPEVIPAPVSIDVTPVPETIENKPIESVKPRVITVDREKDEDVALSRSERSAESINENVYDKDDTSNSFDSRSVDTSANRDNVGGDYNREPDASLNSDYTNMINSWNASDSSIDNGFDR